MPVKAEGTIDQRSSGRTLQTDDRKVRPFVHISDLQDQFQVGIADVELGRVMGNTGVKFNRRFSFDALMRTEFVISAVVSPQRTMADKPCEIDAKLIAQGGPI